MALIKCSECGKEISDKAKQCPNCGIDFVKEKNKETNKKIKQEIKKKIPFVKKIVIIVISIIAFLFVLEFAIDFVGDIYLGMKYQEIYTETKMNGEELYLRLEKNDCGFMDSVYEKSNKTFECSYEIIDGEIYSPKDFNLHLKALNQDGTIYQNYGDFVCHREEMSNTTKGQYSWVSCKSNNDEKDFNVYTKGTNEN